MSSVFNAIQGLNYHLEKSGIVGGTFDGIRVAICLTPDQEADLMNELQITEPPYARDGILTFYGLRIFVRP
jgi:hypothetical protein